MHGSGRTLMKVIGMGLWIAGFGLMSACDDDSSVRGRSFSIEPRTAKLSLASESIVLRAVGGEPPYVWSVSDEVLGRVSSDSHTVTYLRFAPNGVNTVRVVDGQGWSAEMLVHQPPD